MLLGVSSGSTSPCFGICFVLMGIISLLCGSQSPLRSDLVCWDGTWGQTGSREGQKGHPCEVYATKKMWALFSPILTLHLNSLKTELIVWGKILPSSSHCTSRPCTVPPDIQETNLPHFLTIGIFSLNTCEAPDLGAL